MDTILHAKKVYSMDGSILKIVLRYLFHRPPLTDHQCVVEVYGSEAPLGDELAVLRLANAKALNLKRAWIERSIRLPKEDMFALTPSMTSIDLEAG